MAITTYLGLRAAIADTFDRDDLSADVTAFEGTTIDSQIKRAVEKSTLRIQRDLMSRGGHKNMEAVTNSLVTTNGTETLAMPADFLAHRSLILTKDPLVVLQFSDPTSLWNEYPSATTDEPEKFTIIGTSTAYLRPIPDSAYTTRLVYYQKLTALSADTDTNWVLTNHWDIYEAAAMLELCIAAENDERIQYWKANYDFRIEDLMGDDRQTRWAAVPGKPTLNTAIA